jgi:hypothetical protein
MKKYFLFLFSPEKIFKGNGGILFFCSIFLFSCVEPDPLVSLSPEKQDLYITNRDNSVNFANYKTYVIVDSVQVVAKTMDSSSSSVEDAPLILSTVKSELQKLGFVEVDTTQDPDVGISVSVLKFTEEVPLTYYPYTGGSYFGYINPAFYGFPGATYAFPPAFQYYQINVGSISIEMFDLKTARNSGSNQLNAIWSAVLVGSLTESSSGNNNERIVKAITSAFAQSQYLGDGK